MQFDVNNDEASKHSSFDGSPTVPQVDLPPSDNLLSRKMERPARGKPPRVLDLFAGCGGLSLGLQAAGFDIAAAVESDADAARPHGTNLHKAAPEHLLPRDVLTSPDVLSQELGLGPAAHAFDVIVGGPPCQAFARVGRSKLREVHDHPKASLRDPRARLFRE